MLSERMLKKWRKDALRTKRLLSAVTDVVYEHQRVDSDRILQLTQELLDLHL